MSRILVLGDSNALPRSEVKELETWPRLLATLLPEHAIINKSMSSLTAPLAAEILQNQHPKPDYVILQVGLVDCWPRKAGVLVPRLTFSVSVKGISNICENKGIVPLAILIMRPGDRISAEYPTVREEISFYNGILYGALSLYPYTVDVNEFIGPDQLLADDQHINAAGQDVLAKRVARAAW